MKSNRLPSWAVEMAPTTPLPARSRAKPNPFGPHRQYRYYCTHQPHPLFSYIPHSSLYSIHHHSSGCIIHSHILIFPCLVGVYLPSSLRIILIVPYGSSILIVAYADSFFSGRDFAVVDSFHPHSGNADRCLYLHSLFTSAFSHSPMPLPAFGLAFHRCVLEFASSCPVPGFFFLSAACISGCGGFESARRPPVRSRAGRSA